MTANERIEELFNNEEVLEKMLFAETPDALMEVFAENNIVLEDVSGGVYFALKAGAIYLAVSGSVAGALCVVGGVAIIGLAAYAGYRYIKKHV